MTRAIALLVAGAQLLGVLALASAPAAAQDSREEVRITGSRVLLKDVMPACPERACLVDLGAAPPPGSSRLVAAEAIRGAFASAGEVVPKVAAVRVISAARVWSPAELGDWLRPSIERKLPAGVRLVGLQPKSGATLPLLASVGECALPALARRPGPLTTTAMVEILHDGAPVRRVAVQVRLVLSEQAARARVPRGAVITLVIERASATVSANGVALQDSEIGQMAAFRVQATGRVVQARIESATLATVLERP